MALHQLPRPHINELRENIGQIRANSHPIAALGGKDGLGFRFEDAGVADQTRTAGMECGHELSRTIDRFDRSTTTSASRAVSTSESANIVSALCARFAEPRRVDLRDVRGPRQGRRLGQQSSQPHSGTPVGSAGPLAAQLHRRHGPEAGPLPCISARIWVVPFIQRPQVARRALRHGHWARPEPAVTLDQRQVGAETFVENRHAFDDSAWQGALPAPLRDLNSMGMMIPMPPTPRPDGTVTPWLMPSPSTSSLDRPRCSAKLSSCSGFAWNVPSNAFANFLFHSEKQQVDSRMRSKFSLVQFVIVPRNQLADLPLCAGSAGLVPSVGMFIPCPADIGGPASTCVEGAGATGPLAARAGY